ncbi:MAG: hypothetical protein V3R78_10230 [Thermodesulfobacteriota bacterium]
MADNTTINSGVGGDVIATDDIGGVKHQRVKVQHGVDGSATDVSSASPLPVTDIQIANLVGFEIPAYDYIALTYVAAGNGAGEVETVVYKTGGSGGTTVATLTLAYNASDEISAVTKT